MVSQVAPREVPLQPATLASPSHRKFACTVGQGTHKQMKVLALLLASSAYALAQDQTAIEVKPSTPVIQEKDLWERSGLFHPFRRMPRFVARDQAQIWTSPIHTAKSDIKWWAIFGGATAALVASDRWTVQQLPNSSSHVSASNWASRLGSAYSLTPGS